MASPTPTSSEPSSRARIRPTPRLAAGVIAALVVVVGLLVLLRAIQPSAFDRTLAIDRTIDASGGRLSHAQAACYVDKARTKVGSRYLEPGVSIPSSVGQRLTAIRDDCVGIAALGAASQGPADVPDTEAGRQPLRHGQDPALDALWSSCAAGSGVACDELFDRSPIGSQYEKFALSCGGRTPQMSCAAVYGPKKAEPVIRTTTTTAPR
jgi:hypothetical protein